MCFFHSLDRRISLVTISEIPSHWLALGCSTQFKSDLVGNPEDRFCCNKAQIILQKTTTLLFKLIYVLPICKTCSNFLRCVRRGWTYTDIKCILEDEVVSKVYKNYYCTKTIEPHH